MVDFGQWDHEDYYDASYENGNTWGEKRWSTPGALINGKLVTTRLQDLNVGIEEFIEHSYYEMWEDQPYKTDPLESRAPIIRGTNQFHGLGSKIERALQLVYHSTWDRHVLKPALFANVHFSLGQHAAKK